MIFNWLCKDNSCCLPIELISLIVNAYRSLNDICSEHECFCLSAMEDSERHTDRPVNGPVNIDKRLALAQPQVILNQSQSVCYSDHSEFCLSKSICERHLTFHKNRSIFIKFTGIILNFLKNSHALQYLWVVKFQFTPQRHLSKKRQ